MLTTEPAVSGKLNVRKSLRERTGVSHTTAPDPVPGHERMSSRPTLRRELATAFALIIACALFVMALGVSIILQAPLTTRQAGILMTLLLAVDIGICLLLGRWLLHRRVVEPLERMIGGVEAMAAGDLDRRLDEAGSPVLERMSGAVNQVAERLTAERAQLAANIRSLDETNRLLTEARNAMVHAEKMASVGRLSAGVAHEVGNPLGAIIGYLGLLGRNADDGRRELVEAAQREAQRIDRIVRGLLEYARPRETRTQAIRVNEIIEETLELLRVQGRFERVQMIIGLEKGLPEVLGDQYQLQQVLVNLLVNATDALAGREGAIVAIRTTARPTVPPPMLPARRRDDPPEIDYTHRRRLAEPIGRRRGDPSAPSGQIVQIEVEDNGPGIAGPLLDKIFEPFVTTKEPGKGTGLGLAVCERLVESMGGSIRAESDGGGGARFTVLLPAIVVDARRERA